MYFEGGYIKLIPERSVKRAAAYKKLFAQLINRAAAARFSGDIGFLSTVFVSGII